MQSLLIPSDFREAILLCQRLALCSDKESLSSALGACAELLGAEKCIALRLCKEVGDKPTSIHIVNHSYPDEWLALYESRQLGTRDPVLQNHLRHGGLQAWDDILARNPDCSDFASMASEFGLVSGLTHGLVDPSKDCRSLVSFAGRRSTFGPREKLLCDALVAPLHQAVMRLVAKPCPSRAVLTDREREILLWVVRGKTSWEISRLVVVSERTIKFHIANIFRKLNVSNRAQAIGMALEQGLLDSL